VDIGARFITVTRGRHPEGSRLSQGCGKAVDFFLLATEMKNKNQPDTEKLISNIELKQKGWEGGVITDKPAIGPKTRGTK
jgi:hypothetical protein